MKYTITICGGGAIGHICAGIFASNPCTIVNILSKRADKWHSNITIFTPSGTSIKNKINRISKNASDVIPQSDIVLLCVPGYLIESELQQIAPVLKPNTLVGACVASSGFFFAAAKTLPATTKLFGFQRVPYIARVQEYGQSANLLGYKSSLAIGMRNIQDMEKVAKLFSSLFSTPVRPLASYFDAALSNSNPILHPSRLYGMWHNWKPGVYYKEKLKFYEDWDNFSSELLILCDEEFFNVIKCYPCTPGALPRLLDYYESKTSTDLTKKLRSIPAFKGIEAPMLETNYGFIPDWSSRYFLEDIPFGLQIIKNLALDANIETPTIDTILDWYNKNNPIKI